MKHLLKVLALGAALAASAPFAHADTLSGTLSFSAPGTIDAGGNGITITGTPGATTIGTGSFSAFTPATTYGGFMFTNDPVDLNFSLVSGTNLFTATNSNGTKLTFTTVGGAHSNIIINFVNYFFYDAGTLSLTNAAGTSLGTATGYFTLNPGGEMTFSAAAITSAATTAATPEPNSLLLLGTGLVSAAGMLVRRRRLA